MNINIIYTFCDGELAESPIHIIHEDNNTINRASIWLSNHLNLSFQTMDDLDRTIKDLQDLRDDISNHMEITEKQWVPALEYPCNQIVNVSVHEVQQGEIDPAIIGAHDSYDAFDVLRITSLDSEINRLLLFFPSGQTGMIKEFAKNILGKYEEGLSHDTEAGNIGPSEEAR